jgi:hypothetical protein
MSKRTIKLEFEFVARKFVQEQNGVEAIEYSVRPIAEQDFWQEVANAGGGRDIEKFRPCLRSLATSKEIDSLSILALQFHDTVLAYAGHQQKDVVPEKTATFKGPDGKITKVDVPTISYH